MAWEASRNPVVCWVHPRVFPLSYEIFWRLFIMCAKVCPSLTGPWLSTSSSLGNEWKHGFSRALNILESWIPENGLLCSCVEKGPLHELTHEMLKAKVPACWKVNKRKKAAGFVVDWTPLPPPPRCLPPNAQAVFCVPPMIQGLQRCD